MKFNKFWETAFDEEFWTCSSAAYYLLRGNCNISDDTMEKFTTQCFSYSNMINNDKAKHKNIIILVYDFIDKETDDAIIYVAREYISLYR